MTVSTRYQHTGLVLVRATTDPGDLDPPTHLNLFDPAGVEQEGRAWLATVWARSEVREALRLASHALGGRINQLLDDDAGHCSVKELRHIIISVTSYLLRWQRRATPFGMFAGVGTVAIGPAMADVGVGHRAVVRADAEWLTTLIDHLERHPGLRPQLSVVADSARLVRDGRVIVHGLVDGGLLITNLRPPMTTVDAVSHLVRALRAAGGEDLADIAELLHELDEISARLDRHNSANYREQATEIRSALVGQMTALVLGAGHVLAADVRLDARIAVPERVLTEAALAASVLLRVSTQPFGSAAWQAYHARFLSRTRTLANTPAQWAVLLTVWSSPAITGDVPGIHEGARKCKPLL